LRDADTPKTLDQDAHGVIGNLSIFKTRAAQPTSCISWVAVLGLGIALQHDSEQAVAADDVVDELGALGGLD